MTPQLGKLVVYLFASCRSARRLAAMVLLSGSCGGPRGCLISLALELLLLSLLAPFVCRFLPHTFPSLFPSSGFVLSGPVSLCHLLFLFLLASFCLVLSLCVIFFFCFFSLCSVWSCLSVSSSFSVSSGFVPSGPVSLCHLLFLFLQALFRLVLSLCVTFFFCFFRLCSVWSCLSVSPSFSVSSGFVPSGLVSLCHLLFLFLQALFRLVLSLCVTFFFCFFRLCSVWSCLSVSSFSVSSGFVPSGPVSLCHLLFLLLDLRPDITAMVNWAPFLHSSWFNDDDGDGDNFIASDV